MYIRPPAYVGPNIYQPGAYTYQPVYQQRVVPVQTNVYNQAPPVYYQNSNPTYNNSTIYNKNVQSIPLDQALIQSSYPRENHEIINDMMINEYIGNPEAKVYFQYKDQEKLFVVEYVLQIYLVGKSYNVDIYMHIPRTYPDYPPEFYMGKKKGVCINDHYIKANMINGETFQINVEYFCRYNQTKTNIGEIINALKNQFNKTFPVYRSTTTNLYVVPGKNNIDKNLLQQVIIKSEKFTDTQLLNFMRKQVKNIIKNKHSDLNNKYKTPQYYYDLRQMKMELDSSSNYGNNPMSQQVESLKQIKEELNQIENSIQVDIQNIENANGNVLMQCDELVKVKNERDLEFLVKRKILEDYLVFLKKGYEKKVVSLDEMLEQTRTLSREIFAIDYLRKNMKYN
jgi:hypothetical protein